MALHEIELGFPTAATIVLSIEMHRRVSAASLLLVRLQQYWKLFLFFAKLDLLGSWLYPMQGGGEPLVFSKWE